MQEDAATSTRPEQPPDSTGALNRFVIRDPVVLARKASRVVRAA